MTTLAHMRSWFWSWVRELTTLFLWISRQKSQYQHNSFKKRCGYWFDFLERQNILQQNRFYYNMLCRYITLEYSLFHNNQWIHILHIQICFYTLYTSEQKLCHPSKSLKEPFFIWSTLLMSWMKKVLVFFSYLTPIRSSSIYLSLPRYGSLNPSVVIIFNCFSLFLLSIQSFHHLT